VQANFTKSIILVSVLLFTGVSARAQSTTGKQLNEVQVAGKTDNSLIKEQAYNVNVLDAKRLYNTASDLNRALNQTSGIRVREEGGVGSNFTFSLNGFTGRQVKFFLDGIPMDNFGSALTLNNFPVNMAERVEIYKGVLPVSLGADALGGAVNIITRSNPNYLDVSYGYGSFNTHKASANHAFTDTRTGFTVRTNAFFNYSDNNYKVKVKPIVGGQYGPEQEFERFHDGYRSIGAQIEAGITGKKYADKLLIGLIAAGNHKDIQTGVVMEQVFGARTSSSNSVIPTLKYKKSNLFVKGLDLSIYSAYNISRNSFIDTARVKYNWFQQITPTTTGELSRSQLKNRDNDGIITANLAYRMGEHHSASFNYVMTDFGRKSSDVEDLANVTYQYPQQLNKQILGLAWQETYDKFTATAFAKMYVLNAKSFEQFSNGIGNPVGYRASSVKSNNYGYGVASAYFISNQLQAKASYEHTYRLPEAVELLGDGLFTRRNSALKPEYSDNINVGGLYSFTLNDAHKLNIEANYIFRNSHDYIRLDQQQTQPVDRQYINIGDIKTNGVEAEVRYQYKDFRLGVNATYQSIIDKEEFLISETFQGPQISNNLNYGYRIPNTPYLFGNADAGYIFNSVGGSQNSLGITYTLNYTQQYYLTPNHLGRNNDDAIPTQLSHNIVANYNVKDGRYNVSLECRNLTDSDLFDNYRLQKPGRSFLQKLI
jgi:outer membrane receptor protein involved in Fe transport